MEERSFLKNHNELDLKLNELDLSVNLNGLKLKNPITVASGTFGFGREYSEYFDLSTLGAIAIKGITLEARQGNEGRRMVETPMGMLNSVGLQNPGVHQFLKEDLPFLKQYDTAIIANINGHTIEEYCKLAQILEKESIDAIELNISCPNVENGGMAFGTDPETVKRIVSEVRKNCSSRHLMVKLSPNVTDIKVIAKIVEAEGADSISLINTVTGMAIDIYKRKPFLNRKTGGLSGPAIKPIAIKLVHDVFETVKIPILGMGGITSGLDAVEMMLAGASAIAVGTGNFLSPTITQSILEDIQKYMMQMDYKAVSQITGDLK